MSIILSNKEQFSNRKAADLIILETVFHENLTQRCWLVSDSLKKPYNPKTQTSEWGNPDLLCTFEEVREFLQSNPGYMPCIVPEIGNLVIIDLDKVKRTGEEYPEWAMELAKRLRSYCEISQSDTGLHIVLKGERSGQRSIGQIFGCKVEFLTNHCVTLTGNIFKSFDTLLDNCEELQKFYKEIFPPVEKSEQSSIRKSPPLSNPEILSLFARASNRTKFEKLYYDGNIDDYRGDQSSADFALVALVAFYTQNPVQIFEIIKESALYRLPGRQAKWLRDDYRNVTIQRALDGTSEFYQPKKSVNSSPFGTWENPSAIGLDETYYDESFPVHSLPQKMREAVLEIARAVQVDPAMPAISALGAIGLMIGKKTLIEEKKGLEHHPSLFLVCVADPVERKSEVHRRIFDPLRDALDPDIEDYKREKAKIKSHNDALAEQITSVKASIREIAKGKAAENVTIDDLKKRQEELILSKKEFPAHPKFWADDVTPEKLKQNLHANNGTFGLFSAEGRTIFHRILNKDGENVTGKTIYLAGTWGDTLDRQRVSSDESGESECIEIKKPALTIVTFIQSDVWKDFSKDKTMRQNGTISRICVAIPRSKVGTRLETEDEEPYRSEKVAPFIETLNHIRKWKPNETVRITLNKEAARERRLFYNKGEGESGPGGIYEDVRDLVGRSTSIITRIAEILAVFEEASSRNLGNTLPQITAEQWLNAQEIGEYFLAQGIDTQRSHENSDEENIKKAATWLLKCLEKGEPKFLPSVLQNRCRFTKETTDKVIAALISRGLVRPTEKSRGKGVYHEINQKLSEKHRT